LKKVFVNDLEHWHSYESYLVLIYSHALRT